MTEQYEFNGEKSKVRAEAILGTIEPNGNTTIEMVVDEGNPDDDDESDTETTNQGTQRRLGEIEGDSRQHDVLAYIDSTPGCTTEDIAEAYDWTKGSASSACSELWKKRLVSRDHTIPYEYEISTHGKAELERIE